MKKLMIAFAAVAMGVAANAATVDWKVDRDVTSDTKSVLVYAFLGSDRAAVTSLLAGYSTVEAFAANWDSDVSTTFGYSSTDTGSSKGAVDGSIAKASIEDKSVQDVFLVVFDAKTVAGATKYEISDDFSTSAIAYTASSQTSKRDATGVAANFGKAWKDIGSGDVPEPTSAMLLLLGIAGLALKRKVA